MVQRDERTAGAALPATGGLKFPKSNLTYDQDRSYPSGAGVFCSLTNLPGPKGAAAADFSRALSRAGRNFRSAILFLLPSRLLTLAEALLC